MSKNYNLSKLNEQRKDLEFEFARQKKKKEDELLLDQVFDETELPDWE